MIQVKVFPVNPFQMNMYVLHDETSESIIIDPGNSTYDEDKKVIAYLTENNLHLSGIFFTHCHIDHIPGAYSLFEKFAIRPSFHKGGLSFLKSAENSAHSFGIRYKGSVEAERFIDEGDLISFGRQQLQVFHTPGHADGSLCFYSKDEKIVFVGDVLFNGSIGRTDLPTGSFSLLEKSIREKLYTLPNDTVVYSGHGKPTTIGNEKLTNPFFKQ